ncbi:hypothetical protein [Streptomyces sp. CC228A]|uniref:hypothetical protein n=1 Tax=Streptomyces sp. CC228A TaxID=2898186 RepID=UPI001F24BFE5|nr:hypothetical protein [Streptomyces sp. CC228A]
MFLLTVFVEEAEGDALALRPLTAVPLPVLLLFAVSGGALLLRRRRPLLTLALVVAAWLPTLGSSYATAGGCVLVALYGAGRYAPDTRRGRAARRRRRRGDRRARARRPAAAGALGRPPSAPPSWPAPGTWDGACGCVRSAPTGGAGSSSRRPAGSSPRNAPTSPANSTTSSPTG